MPQALLLHQFFALQAQRTPSAIAAVDGSTTITYAQLAQRAQQITLALQRRGVGVEQRVGLCVQRSFDFLAALIGILQAGAAYVPLDPQYPCERIGFMCENASLDLIVAQHATRAGVEKAKTPLLLLDEIAADPDAAPVVLPPLIPPSGLAYLMFTSGSTGKPKGVMIEHRQVVPFIQWTLSFFSKRQFAATLCANSVSFDVSIFEIFATLAAGGTLVLTRSILDLLTDPPLHPISTMITVPSALTEIVRAKAIPDSLETIIFGGERLSHALVHELYTTTHVRDIYNSWGVTEDSIASTFVHVARDTHEDPPMGQAIEGCAVYLLDEDLLPVPLGATGELFCAGYGVARGYTGDTRLNAERYLPNPFGTSPTMYRTGDFAFCREDGALVFVGRKDQQIKMHGFRIELGEIEAMLETHPAIAQAVVLAQLEQGRLEMYAVLKAGHIVSQTQLQLFLARSLPAHMVPSSLICVERFPLNTSGKVDRHALSLLGQAEHERAAISSAPTNPIEETLARLFAQSLGLKRVGIDENFFALGGKSLAAARLATEIRHAFPNQVAQLEGLGGRTVLARVLALDATVRYVAAVLQQPTALPSRRHSLWCIQAGSAQKRPLFLFHGVIDGEGLYCYEVAKALAPDQPVYALAPHGADGGPIPPSVEAMARDYLARIEAIQPHGPYHFMGYCNGGLVAFECARILAARREAIETLVLIATPGHNVRSRFVKRCVRFISRVLGITSEDRSRQLFLNTRDTVYLGKYAGEFLLDVLASLVSRKNFPRVTPRQRLQRMRELGPQSENARFVRIMQAVQAYVPEPYLGRISLLWGKQDEYLSYYDPLHDWKRVSPHIDIAYVDGDHHFLDTQAVCLVDYFPPSSC